MPRRRPVLVPDTRIEEFAIVNQIGSGGYGDIYIVRDTATESCDLYALKLEFVHSSSNCLPREIHIMQQLQHSPYFPSLVAAGITDQYRWFVMELLGPSLASTRRVLPHRRYSAYTFLILAREMLNAIYMFHRKGYCHRDIKPANFLIKPDRKYPICLIDYGLSFPYLDSQTHRHIRSEARLGFAGTGRYASINAHRGMQLSRRDDLFSWFYSVIELAAGRLPWPGSADKARTLELKESLTVEQLCQGLPLEFDEIYRYLLTIGFEAQPRYRWISQKITRAIRRGSFETKIFDWESLPAERARQITVVSLTMGGLGDEDVNSMIPPGCGCGCFG
jgi:serine/threonine protein kinase